MRVLGAIAKYLWNRDGARLAIGTIVDGEFLKRDGNTIVSDAGGGSGAPTSATYVTLTTNATLTDERTLAVGTGLDLVDGGAGSTVTVQLDLSEVSSGGDLGGTMDAPTVTQARGLRETGGPTTLTMASVADGEVLFRSGSTIDGRPTASVNAYDSATSTTLSPPSWATRAHVQTQGGGAGGVGGARANVGSTVSGGGGGGAGCLQQAWFDLASLPADKTLTIVVGAGGTGGAGAAVNGNGGNGTDGDPSYVAASDGVVLCYSRGGGNGSAGSGGSISTGDTEYDGSNGGNGGNGAAGSTPTTVFRYAPAGGGGGGGITSGNSAQNGGTGGWGGNARNPAGSTNGGAGGTAAGTRNGTSASAQSGRRAPGGGGGGASGAGDGSVNGGNGGDGIAGSGGGGGGAAHASATAGDGGDGGAGWVVVTFW